MNSFTGTLTVYGLAAVILAGRAIRRHLRRRAEVRAEANLRRQETEAGIARLEQYANTGKASL